MRQKILAEKPKTPSSPAPASVLQAKTRGFGPGGGEPLAGPVRERMEAALGHDFGSVRVHAGDRSAPRIGAMAYTRGEHLHFAPGAYRPDTSAGRAALGHELTHVVQQRQGRVRPNRPGALPLNDSSSLEREADTHGARAARGGGLWGATALPVAPTPARPAASAPVQMIPWWKKALYGAAAVGGGALAIGASGGLALAGAGIAAASGISALLDHRNERQEAERQRAHQEHQTYLRGPEGIRDRKQQDRDQRRLRDEAQGNELRRTGNQRTRGNLQELHALHANLRESGANPLLHRVLTEMLSDDVQQNTVVEGGSGTSNGETGRTDDGHVARLDDLETDPTRRQSYLLHELTHVSADRKYSMNRQEGAQFFNEPHVGANTRELGQHLRARQGQVTAQAEAGKDVAWNDETLPQGEREYVHDRLHYMGSVPNQEYDTVANELLLYAHQKGLPADSPTVQHIHGLAQDAYDRRNGRYATTGQML
ncbi:MAG TPA: DUF4157 domain-containing protein [Longimicrobiaceae bacterium]